MSTLLTRAPRALMFAVATLFALSLLAPLAAFANTDFSIGDQAAINNPNGTGANLRTDITVLDESTIITELTQDTPVTIVDGPFVADTGVWFRVSTGTVEGYVESTLIKKVDSTPAEAPAAPEAPVVSGIPWMEPIDTAVVVDDNAELPAEGLAVRVSATVDGEIIGRAPVGTWLDVTEQRTWVGEQSFVRVNFNGQGGYVNGNFVTVTSEQATQEPVVEDVPTEEVPVEVPTEEIPVEVPAEEVPVEVPTEELPVEVPAEEVPVDVPAEEPVVEEPVTEEAPVVEEAAQADVPEEAAPVMEEPAAELPAEEPVVVEPAADVTGEVAPVVEEPAATAEVPVEDVAAEEPAATAEVPAEAVETEEVTEEVVATEEAPAQVASSVPAFDPATMIGSATVTGTLDGLRCRVAPDAESATLMVLSEGTTVQVFAESANGYLGIDCGGLKGYADVNYLWSGGAGDGEIQNANMTIVVSGTGNGLNCRTGAGTNYPVITVLFDGTSLTTRGAATGGWTPVVCGGQNGFVSTTWVAVTGSAPSTGNDGGSSGTAGTATVVNTGGDGLYCRTGAGTSYAVITILSPGQTVPTRGGAQGSWIPVTCGGQNGFASSQFLSVSAGTSNPAPAPSNPAPAPAPQPSSPTGSVTVANTGGMGLNCRSGAGTSYGVIAVLSLGQSVSTRSGSVNGWTAVICGGQNGFVSSEFVTSGGTAPAPNTPAPAPAPQPSGMVSGNHAQSTADVNLRYSASLSSGVATVVPTGTVVLITGTASNGFYPVDYDGLGGFMSADYLVKTDATLTKRGGSANPAPAPAPAPGGTASGNALVSYAMNYVGYPYVWATHGPSSFDCSGFTYWVVKNVTGKNIGTGTWTQVSAGTSVSRSNLQPGDLVFFQNTYTAGLSHVGLYIGNNQFVHAQNEATGVVVSSLDSQYYASRWYGAVRVI